MTRELQARAASEQALMQRAFTLIEVLVTVAVIALLIAILVPSLAAAREASRTSTCQANLRQAFFACRIYADGNRGAGPAIGEPYNALPNWALLVQKSGSRSFARDAKLYRADSVLVCPTIRSVYGMEMTRTYAMNATGHAGAPADPAKDTPPDPDTYDDPLRPAFIRLDRIARPASAAILLDSARSTPATGGAPPSARTASVLDFRQPEHVSEKSAKRRIGAFHRRATSFNVAAADGSVSPHRVVRQEWSQPLP